MKIVSATRKVYQDKAISFATQLYIVPDELLEPFTKYIVAPHPRSFFNKNVKLLLITPNFYFNYAITTLGCIPRHATGITTTTIRVIVFIHKVGI
jgi:hypothetical protein